MADHPPPVLTIAHQGLAACLVQVCVDVIRGDDIEDAITMMAEILPQAHGDGPMAEALIGAAGAVGAAWPGRLDRDGGSLRWNAACSAASAACLTYYRGRAVACHDRIFPQPATQPEAAR